MLHAGTFLFSSSPGLALWPVVLLLMSLLASHVASETHPSLDQSSGDSPVEINDSNCPVYPQTVVGSSIAVAGCTSTSGPAVLRIHLGIPEGHDPSNFAGVQRAALTIFGIAAAGNVEQIVVTGGGNWPVDVTISDIGLDGAGTSGVLLNFTDVLVPGSTLSMEGGTYGTETSHASTVIVAPTDSLLMANRTTATSSLIHIANPSRFAPAHNGPASGVGISLIGVRSTTLSNFMHLDDPNDFSVTVTGGSQAVVGDGQHPASWLRFGPRPVLASKFTLALINVKVFLLTNESATAHQGYWVRLLEQPANTTVVHGFQMSVAMTASSVLVVGKHHYAAFAFPSYSKLDVEIESCTVALGWNIGPNTSAAAVYPDHTIPGTAAVVVVGNSVEQGNRGLITIRGSTIFSANYSNSVGVVALVHNGSSTLDPFRGDVVLADNTITLSAGKHVQGSTGSLGAFVVFVNHTCDAARQACAISVSGGTTTLRHVKAVESTDGSLQAVVLSSGLPMSGFTVLVNQADVVVVGRRAAVLQTTDSATQVTTYLSATIVRSNITLEAKSEASIVAWKAPLNHSTIVVEGNRATIASGSTAAVASFFIEGANMTDTVVRASMNPSLGVYGQATAMLVLIADSGWAVNSRVDITGNGDVMVRGAMFTSLFLSDAVRTIQDTTIDVSGNRNVTLRPRQLRQSDEENNQRMYMGVGAITFWGPVDRATATVRGNALIHIEASAAASIDDQVTGNTSLAARMYAVVATSGPVASSTLAVSDNTNIVVDVPAALRVRDGVLLSTVVDGERHNASQPEMWIIANTTMSVKNNSDVRVNLVRMLSGGWRIPSLHENQQLLTAVSTRHELTASSALVVEGNADCRFGCTNGACNAVQPFPGQVSFVVVYNGTNTQSAVRVCDNRHVEFDVFAHRARLFHASYDDPFAQRKKFAGASTVVIDGNELAVLDDSSVNVALAKFDLGLYGGTNCNITRNQIMLSSSPRATVRLYSSDQWVKDGGTMRLEGNVVNATVQCGRPVVSATGGLNDGHFRMINESYHVTVQQDQCAETWTERHASGTLFSELYVWGSATSVELRNVRSTIVFRAVSGGSNLPNFVDVATHVAVWREMPHVVTLADSSFTTVGAEFVGAALGASLTLERQSNRAVNISGTDMTLSNARVLHGIALGNVSGDAVTTIAGGSIRFSGAAVSAAVVAVTAGNVSAPVSIDGLSVKVSEIAPSSNVSVVSVDRIDRASVTVSFGAVDIRDVVGAGLFHVKDKVTSSVLHFGWNGAVTMSAVRDAMGFSVNDTVADCTVTIGGGGALNLTSSTESAFGFLVRQKIQNSSVRVTAPAQRLYLSGRQVALAWTEAAVGATIRVADMASVSLLSREGTFAAAVLVGQTSGEPSRIEVERIGQLKLETQLTTPPVVPSNGSDMQYVGAFVAAVGSPSADLDVLIANIDSINCTSRGLAAAVITVAFAKLDADLDLRTVNVTTTTVLASSEAAVHLVANATVEGSGPLVSGTPIGPIGPIPGLPGVPPGLPTGTSGTTGSLIPKPPAVTAPRTNHRFAVRNLTSLSVVSRDDDLAGYSAATRSPTTGIAIFKTLHAAVLRVGSFASGYAISATVTDVHSLNVAGEGVSQPPAAVVSLTAHPDAQCSGNAAVSVGAIGSTLVAAAVRASVVDIAPRTTGVMDNITATVSALSDLELQAPTGIAAVIASIATVQLTDAAFEVHGCLRMRLRGGPGAHVVGFSGSSPDVPLDGSPSVFTVRDVHNLTLESSSGEQTVLRLPATPAGSLLRGARGSTATVRNLTGVWMSGSPRRVSVMRPVAASASLMNWSIVVGDISCTVVAAESSSIVDAMIVTATMPITIERVRLNHTSPAPYTASLTATSLAVLLGQSSASVTLRNTTVNIRRRRVTVADGGGAANAESMSAALVLIGSAAVDPPRVQVTVEASSVVAEAFHGYAAIDGAEYDVKVRAAAVAVSSRVFPATIILNDVEVRSFATLTSSRTPRAKTIARTQASLVDLASASSVGGRIAVTVFNASVSAVIQNGIGQTPHSGRDGLLGYTSETGEARSAVMLFAEAVKPTMAGPNALFASFSCTDTDGLRKPHQQRAQLDPVVANGAATILFPENEACLITGTATMTHAATRSGLTGTASSSASPSSTLSASASQPTVSLSHPTGSGSRTRTATVWSLSRTRRTATLSPSRLTRTPSSAATASAVRTLSKSLPLPPQVQPVEVPDAVEAIETTNAAAAVTTSAMAASPATAVQAARTGVLLRAQYCNTQVDLPPAFYDSPTAASITVDDSDRVLRYQVGAAVANPLLLLGCVALHAAVALVHWLVAGRSAKDQRAESSGDEPKKHVPVMEPEHVGTYAGSLTWARFPSVLVFPGLFLLQPTVTAIVTIIAHGASGATIATVVAPSVVVLLALAGLAHVTLVGAGTRGVYVVEQFDEYAATGKPTPIIIRAFDYVFAGEGRWSDPVTDKATGWTRRFFGLFGDYTGKARWFLLVEGFVCVALGVCAGLLPFSNCKAMNWFLFAFFLCFLGVVLAIRPQDARFDLWVSVLLTTSQLIASAMNVFGASEDIRGSVEGVLAFAMMANLLQGIAKVVAVAFKTLRRGKRREARAMLAAKKAGSGGGRDRDGPPAGTSAGLLDQGALQAALLSAAREDEARITAEAEHAAATTAVNEAAAQQRRHVDAPDWGTDGPYVGHREGADDDQDENRFHGGHDSALDDIAALLNRPVAAAGATGGREGVRRIEAFDVGHSDAYDGLAGGHSSPDPHNYDGDSDDEDAEATAAAHAADEAINAPLRLMSSVANAATSVLGAVPINASRAYADADVGNDDDDDGLDALLSDKPPAKEETQSSAPSFDDDDLDLL